MSCWKTARGLTMGRMEDDTDQSVRQGLGIIAGGCTGQDAPSLLHGPVQSPASLPSGRLPADHGRQGIGRPHGGGGEAVREGRVTVGRDATLFYAPLPVLPFADSAFRSAFAIELADETSRLFYSDILACGRAARGERFAYRLYRSRVYITSGGTLLYADNFRFAPQEDGADCEGFIQYEGYTHLGNYVLCHFPVREEDLRACFRPILDVHDCQAGLTRFGETNLCLKVLANGSEMLVALQARIKDFLRCA